MGKTKWHTEAMSTALQKLTFEEFQSQYQDADRAFEFWYGEAIPKGAATLVHGFLQKTIMKLLDEAGFNSAGDVELRIEASARPRPDVVATKHKFPKEPYPTKAVEVVVEIVSEDDSYSYLREKCRKYQSWGFQQIYLVDPSDRSVQEWKDGSAISCDHLAGVSVEQIWEALDASFE